MTITEMTINRVSLSDKEKFAFDLVDELLAELQDRIYPDKSYFMSINTGECIDYDSLAIARGVISGIRNSESWEIKS